MQPPKKSIFTKKSTPPLALTESRTDPDEPEIVTILSKPFGTLRDKYLTRRLVAQAQLAPEGMRFHNHVIPAAHMILFFEAIVATELTTPIARGHLDYKDPDYDTQNLSELPRGQVFHWLKALVSRDILPDFQADLQAFIQSSDTKMSDGFKEDKVIKKACTNNNKAC
jgi:hypothetical protein